MIFDMETRQYKEQIIVGNLINCNKEIKNFLNESSMFKTGRLRKLFESNKYDIYGYNLKNLYSNILGVNVLNLDESTIISDNNILKNTRKNYYSYFKKLYEFLNVYEPAVMKSLNESLTVDSNKVENPVQLNILSFKNELKIIIDKLSKQNDLTNYSSDILKIKTFAKQPLFVNGYNICNNIALQKELQEKFNILYQNIIAICFNQTTKQLYFVTNNTSKIVVYDVAKDVLDYYNNVNEQKIEVKQLTGETYFEDLKKLTGYNSIIELYTNVQVLNIHYTDNLYHDVAYNDFRNKLKQQQSNIIK